MARKKKPKDEALKDAHLHILMPELLRVQLFHLSEQKGESVSTIIRTLVKKELGRAS